MMTPDRFRALAEAYGGELARWPTPERAAAEAFAAARAMEATELLSSEQQLDALLAGYPVALRSQLRERVIASVSRPRPARRAWRWAAAASLGLGLAGSAAAGLAAGLTLAPPGVARLISGSQPGNDALADLLGDAGEG